MYILVKQRLIDILKREFGDACSSKWALQHMGKNLNWRRDKIRNKIKKTS